MIKKNSNKFEPFSDKKLTCVVLSGGAGLRLWPVSRESQPKPFMKLSDNETLIQKTYARVKALGSRVLTVTNRDYYFMSLQEQERAGLSGRFLLEPFGRDTAPAIALAAKAIVANEGENSIMLVLPADHLIADNPGFFAAVEDAVAIAQSGGLVTFGVLPSSPETGFGYIEQGSPFGVGYQVERFVEKPDLENAKHYVNSGNYLWNSGMFCFKPDVFLDELAKHAPDVAAAIDVCWSAVQPLNNAAAVNIPAEHFKLVPNISVDYAVMEKTDKAIVLPTKFGWSDIGSWVAIRDLVKPDAAKNRVIGDALFVDTFNTFARSDGRLVAAVGVNDLMIIDTPDALLVVNSNRAQDLKKLASKLKAIDHVAYRTHRTVVRPWGEYTVLEEAPGFKIKRIEVKSGASLSLQMHEHRSEHWVVVNGTAKITNGNDSILVKANESTYIPAGQKHRLENPGSTPCIMVEVQCGSYLEEDDIIRFDDSYGRV